jgi:hypothetical protein
MKEKDNKTMASSSSQAKRRKKNTEEIKCKEGRELAFLFLLLLWV